MECLGSVLTNKYAVSELHFRLSLASCDAAASVSSSSTFPTIQARVSLLVLQEGLPHGRYYGGNEYIDMVEELCQKR